MAMLHIGPFTSNEITPDGDEYVTTEIDEAGERKVTPDGHLLGGREYILNTFTLPNRGNKLFMLATESAKELNYRDSYLLFNKNKNLYKLIATQHDKETLIQSGLLPFSFRSRQIAVVTARSMFCQFGSRIIKNGKRVRDDYWEGKAIEQGFTENDPVITDRRSLTAHNLQAQQNNPNANQGMSFGPFRQQQPQFQVSAQYRGSGGGGPSTLNVAGGPPGGVPQGAHGGGPQGSQARLMQGGGPVNGSANAAAQQPTSPAAALLNAAANPQIAYQTYLQNLSSVNYYVNPNSVPRDKRYDYPDENAQASVLSSLMSSGNSYFFIPGSDIQGSFDYQDIGPVNHHHHHHHGTQTMSEEDAARLCLGFNKSLGDARTARITEWSYFWVNKFDDNHDILNEEKENILAVINGEVETDKEPITDLKIPMLNKPVKGELEQPELPPVYIPEPPLVQKIRQTMAFEQTTHTGTHLAPQNGGPGGPGPNRGGSAQSQSRHAQQHNQNQNMSIAQTRLADPGHLGNNHYGSNGNGAGNGNGNVHIQGRSMAQQMYYANNMDNMSAKLQQQPNQSLNWRGQPAPWNNYHG